MKGLFIYKYLTLGGVESVLRTRLAGLPALGIEAEAWFMSGGPGASLFEAVAEQVKIGDAEDLADWIFSSPPDVACVIDTEEALGVLGGFGSTLPVVVESHSPYRENRVYLYWLARANIRSFLVPSRYQARAIERRARSIAPVMIVPNPVPESFVAAPTRFDPTPPSPIVAWIGRLDALKDWKACIRIVGRRSAALPAPELWIVGEPQGAEGDRRLYEYARRQGVLRNMRWYPSFPHDRMPRLLDAVRDSGGVVLSTSREESFGMSVAEAMARECPVVVPSSGPFPEFVEHGVTGRLYQPGDVRQAAGEVAVFLQDTDARRSCGRRAREAILARHAPEVALRLLADELHKVVADSPRAMG